MRNGANLAPGTGGVDMLKSRGRPKGQRQAAPTRRDTDEAMRLLKHRAAAGDTSAAGWLVLTSLVWEARAKQSEAA